MREEIISKRYFILRHNNSGFTLVELVVVLLLMAILLSLSIGVGLGWYDWSRFKHENAVAEEIFFAAQNQLTELDSSGSMENKIIKPLYKIDADNNSYDSSIVLTQNILEQITYTQSNGSNSTYKWDTVWKLNQNPEKEKGTILRLRADAEDYKKYLDGSLVTDDDYSKMGAQILFDLVTPYISDSGVLNGAIVLEFSPEAAQVFSVCYSDVTDTFLYKNESVGEGQTSLRIDDRTLTTRQSKMIGYYSVEELAQKIRGGNKVNAKINLELKNEETLMLVLTDNASGSDKIKDGDKIIFNVYDGTTQGKNCIMSFNVAYNSIADYGSFSYKDAIEKASKNPLDVNCKMLEGVYKGEENASFRLPVWRQNDKIYVVFDAADVQAQTLTYSMTKPFSSTYKVAEDEAFRNTFSFYRFGFAETNRYISVGVQVQKFDYTTTREIRSNNECATFASYVKKDEDAQIGISNPRHFYNIRYETDYKRNPSRSNIFILQDDLSWSAFTGGNEDGINYFLNSYSLAKTSGINYDGKSFATRIVGTESTDYTNTSMYPFPGFRKLDKKDVFTQALAYGETSDDDNTLKSFTISDIDLSVSANIVYGVYGDTIKKQCVSSGTEDYSSILGVESETDDSTGSNPARAGKLPLGLFAENLGEITNITLNRHVVNGVEKINNSIVYTCMVGGFTGNNIGKLDKLMLLDNVTNSLESDKANVSKVIGRTDVGGILGRNSFVIATAGKNVLLKNLSNYAKVMGIENVGGIAGRVYVNYVDSKSSGYDRFKYYHDGYAITDENKSMSGEDVVRAESVNIENCINRGYVYGISNDENFLNETIDDKKVSEIKASFIGGIVGSLVDGLMYDDDSFNTNGNILLESYDNFINGSDSKVKIKSCTSFVTYETSDFSKLSDDKIHPSLNNDNYVGGLVGYGRLAAIENCNTSPENEDLENGVSKTFVFGNRYVGGIIGCSDMCRYDETKETDSSEETSEYTVTNYNNVIGRFIVGGIAGANGIGDINKNTFSFRNPSQNMAGPATQPSSDDGYNIMRKALNKGVVLTLYSEEPFAEGIVDGWKSDEELQEGEKSYKDVYLSDALTGLCGGIVGMNVSGLAECDNIQSEAVKKFETRLIVGSDVNLYGKTADEIEKFVKNSKYGGNVVGGIAGYVSGSGYINKNNDGTSSNYSSNVDAIVYGQDYVGGVFGTSLRDGSYVENCFPYKESDESTGLLVIGRDSVGGIAGRLSSEYISSLIKETYLVRGRNAVGGIAGTITTSKDVSISFDPEGMGNLLDVQGIAYVGGYAGVCDSEETKLVGVSGVQIDLDDVYVGGKYFVGGVAGCLGGSGNNAYYIANMTNGFMMGSNVMINADIFAGGIAGLYTIDPQNEDFYTLSSNRKSNNSNLHWLVTNKLMSGDQYLAYQDVFKNVVNGDITADGINNESIFVKSSTEIEMSFGNSSVDYTVSEPIFSGKVISNLFAGGLFGYVPNGLNVTIDGFVNNGSICVKGSVSESMVGEAIGDSDNVRYSYLGGVVGRVSSGMTLLNCINEKTGAYYENSTNTSFYSSQATYLGGLTEVNAGVISGKGIIEGNDEPQYLISSTARQYDGTMVGGIAGVNGTKYTNVYFEDGNLTDSSTGVIKYCQNIGNIITNGIGSASAGIVVSIGGSSAVYNCSNKGNISSGDGYSSGIAGELDYGGTDSSSITYFGGNTNTGTINGATGASGILGYDLGGQSTYIENDTNFGEIKSDFSDACGIVSVVDSPYHVSGDSGILNIKNCINHGSVNAGNNSSVGKYGCAAGILSKCNLYSNIDSCVNTGVITIQGLHPVNISDEDDKIATNVAGIVCDPGEKGIITLCRNYGTGLYYGITKEKAAQIHFCLDASNAKEHIGQIYDASTNPENKFANYYFGEEEVDTTEKRFKAWREYDASTSEETDDVVVDLTFSMLSPYQTADSTTSTMSEGDLRSAKVKNENSRSLRYIIQPVKNIEFLPGTNTSVELFKIVWDNCYFPDITTDYTVVYRVLLYNNTDDDIPDNDLCIDTGGLRTVISASEASKDTVFDLTGLRNSFALTQDGKPVKVVKPDNYSIDNISKIEIVLDGCFISDEINNAIDTIGIRTVMIKEKGKNSLEVPDARDKDEDLKVNPFAGVINISDMIARLSDYESYADIFEDESIFYVLNDSPMTYKMMIHKLEVGIDGLEYNPFGYQDYYIDYSSYEIARHRKNVYEELDERYLEIITPIMNDLF